MSQQFESETPSLETLALRVPVSAKVEEESNTERSPAQAKTETLAQTLAALVAEAPARKRLRQRLAALCLIGAGVTVGSTLLGMLSYPTASDWIVFSQYSGLAALGITVVTVVMIQRQLRDPRLKQISELDDVRAIALLLDLMENSQEMWEYDDPSRRAMKYALIRLLPQLQASDVRWLTEAHRAALLRILYYCTHRKYPWHYRPDLAVALLGALEQVGSGDALEYVQELAALPQGDARQERIREAAQACVPFLQIRAREQNAMATLLRASQESIDSDQLLRPHGPEQMRKPADPAKTEP